MEINKDTICIETDYMFTHSGYEFGEDQAYINYPVRFPTVTFALRDTHELNMIADAIRKEAGELPMFDDSGEYDDQGWYNFSVGINTYTNSHADNRIEFVVCNGIGNDNEQSYYIDLTDNEQMRLYAVLDEQCRGEFEKSCWELLMEAQEEIEE